VEGKKIQKDKSITYFNLFGELVEYESSLKSYILDQNEHEHDHDHTTKLRF
jgi:hypothetical protein